MFSSVKVVAIGPRRHEAHVEQHDIVEVLGDGLKVVVHRDDRAAVLSQVLEQLQHRVLSRRVDASEGLVHEIEPRVLGEGPRQEHPLLLTTRGAG